MASRHLLFRTLYRVGFTPWDGHPLARSLRDLIEGAGDSPALPPGTALDLGCGTGDNSIYLAKHGWHVTGVDFVAKPLKKARDKAAAANVTVTFAQADVTRLNESGVGDGFALIIDSGCLHGMSDDDRAAYVHQVTTAAATGARLLIVAFVPGGRAGVPGIEPAEMERRFTPDWNLLSTGVEPTQDRKGKSPARHYLFERS